MIKSVVLNLALALFVTGLAVAAPAQAKYRSPPWNRLTSNPPVSPEGDALAILTNTLDSEKGKAVRISSVGRTGRVLLIETQVGAKIEIPYINEYQARVAYNRISRGDSIDLSQCFRAGQDPTSLYCMTWDETPCAPAETREFDLL